MHHLQNCVALQTDQDESSANKQFPLQPRSARYRFSADGETLLGDETSLAYYMSLKGIVSRIHHMHARSIP